MREWEYERLAQLHSEVIPHFYVLCGLREPSVAESDRCLSMCLSGIAAEAPEAERTKKFFSRIRERLSYLQKDVFSQTNLAPSMEIWVPGRSSSLFEKIVT